MHDNIKAMMEFTEVLKNEPRMACTYIHNNAHRFTKDGLTDILKEILFAIDISQANWYGDLNRDILRPVQIVLDKKYDEAYQGYTEGIEN